MIVGFWQIFLVLLIVLILFGAGKLPQVMHDIGRGLSSLRKAMDGDFNGYEQHKREQGAIGDTEESVKNKQ